MRYHQHSAEDRHLIETCRIRWQNALASGKMNRPDRCSNCDIICKPEGHHTDYSRPLEVIWLCHPCHRKADKALAKQTRITSSTSTPEE